MFEELNQHRAAVAENIQKAMEIGFTGNELEKAHKVGDIHPNGKWVWTQLPSGKYDWRVIKKTGVPSGGSAPAAAQKTAQSGEDLISKVPGLKNLREYLTTFNSKYTDFDKVSLSKTPKGNWDVRYDGHRLGIMNGDQISESVVKKMGFHLSKEEKEKMREDSFAREKEKREKLAKELDYDDAEYKRQKPMAAKASDEALSFGLNLVKSNLSNKEKELEKTRKERPGAKATITKLENEVKYFKGQEKALSEEMESRKKKQANKISKEEY